MTRREHDRAGPAGRHALVVGGGIGGLLAGLGLRRRFSRVTIVERDCWPATPAPRRGAPQGRCLHMLAAEGLRVIEGLVPGVTAELVRAGAEPFDVGSAGALRLPSGWLPRVPAGIEMLACSRALLEHVLHARARAEAGMRLVAGRAVRGLRVAGGRVVGVEATEGEALEDAELTVVAAGARSALGRWWAALGLPAVEEAVVPAQHGYVSRWFEIPAGFAGGWKLLSITPAPGVPWGGAIFAAEGGRWGMVLLVPRGEPVPRDDEALRRACARLVDRSMAEALAEARPLGPIVRHEHTDSRRTFFERLEGAWPEGMVVVGDAACSLDPYFGLGMTACARGVAALVEREWDEPGAAQAFQRELGRIVDVPWRLATGDLPPSVVGALHRRRLLHAAPRSPELARLLLRRMHLLDPPDAIDGPEVRGLVDAVLGAPTLTRWGPAPSRA